MTEHPRSGTDLRFDDQTIAVTGAASGLGKAYAELLGSLGARVVLADLDPAVESVAAGIRDRGGAAETVVGSIDDPATSTRIVEVALAIGGSINGIVNNAGIGLERPFGDTDLADFRRMQDIHLYGALHLIREAWPHMVAAGYGRILNVVSATLYGFEGWTAYAAAKGAVFGMTRTLALEAEPLGIRVNMIAPGAATGMLFGNSDDPEIIRRMTVTMPPEAVASTAAFLVHSDCELNGITLRSFSGHVSKMVLGTTTGMNLADSSVTTVGAAVRDRRMDAGLVAETSVASGLSRRGTVPLGFDRPTAVRQALDSLSRLDVDTFGKHLAEDVVFALPYAPESVPNRTVGSEAVLELLRTTFGKFEKFEFTVDRIHDSGDTETVVVESTSEALRKDGTAYRNRYVQTIAFRGSLITRWTEYFDPSLLQGDPE